MGQLQSGKRVLLKRKGHCGMVVGQFQSADILSFPFAQERESRRDMKKKQPKMKMMKIKAM